VFVKLQPAKSKSYLIAWTESLYTLHSSWDINDASYLANDLRVIVCRAGDASHWYGIARTLRPHSVTRRAERREVFNQSLPLTRPPSRRRRRSPTTEQLHRRRRDKGYSPLVDQCHSRLFTRRFDQCRRVAPPSPSPPAAAAEATLHHAYLDTPHRNHATTNFRRCRLAFLFSF